MANEANIIKIKRSGTSGAPASLKLGELAYSYLTASGNPTSNGGDRLFIGANGTNGSGNANDVIVIGGKYFTDLLDHARGTLTASSALIVDSDKKLDELLVDNLSLNGNTLSTTSGDLNVILSANGTGKVQINTSSNSFTLPTTRTSVNGYVLTANTDGTTSWAQASSSVSLKAGTGTGDSGTDATFSLINDDIEFRGDAKAITTALSVTSGGGHNHYVVTTSARLASTSVTGVASFSSSTFDVSILGDVSVKSGGISNTQLANSSIYIGDTSISLGNSSGAVDSLNIDITGNAATADSVNHSLSSGTDLEFDTGTTFDGSTAVTLSVTSTLDSVTGRGDSTANSITVGGLTIGSGPGSYTFPTADGTAGYVLTAHNDGTLTWAQASSSLTLSADGGGPRTVNLIDDTLNFVGGTNINTVASAGSDIDVTFNLDSDLVSVNSISSTANTGSVILKSTDGTAKRLEFTGAGVLTLPNKGIEFYDSNNIAGSKKAEISLDGELYISSADNKVIIYANNSGGNTKSWQFNIDGSTTFPNYTLPAAASTTAGYVLTDVAGNGTLSWEAAAASFTVGGSAGPGETLDLLTDTFSTIGSDSNISVAVTKVGTVVTSTITLASSLTNVSIDGNAATVTDGVYTTGSYANPSWITNIDYNILNGTTPTWNQDTTGNAGSVTNGVYTTDTSTVTNTMLANSSIEVNGTSFTLGSTGGTITANTTNALANGSNIQTFSFDGSTSGVTVALATEISLTSVEATSFYTSDLTISGSTIQTGNTIGDVVLVANNGGGDKTYTFGGDGNLEVAGKITNVSTPTDATDAANKAYVDATAQGLRIHAPAMVATTTALTATYDNGTSGVGATLTFATPVNTLDSYSLSNTNRILVKDQADAKQNGVYVRTSSTVWTRADDFNAPSEISGADFLFIEKGAAGGSTGWVQTNQVVSGVGSSDVTFVQFSAANSYLAGDGIDITGNTIAVKLATNSGLDISTGSLSISGIAGTAATTGLTYSAGVLQIGTDGTSIGINASGYLEIKSTWVGQSAITTLGTITTGTWTATAIDATHGGTNQTTWAKGDLLYASAANTLSKLAAGTNGQMLQLQDGLPVWADLDGGTYGP